MVGGHGLVRAVRIDTIPSLELAEIAASSDRGRREPSAGKRSRTRLVVEYGGVVVLEVDPADPPKTSSPRAAQSMFPDHQGIAAQRTVEMLREQLTASTRRLSNSAPTRSRLGIGFLLYFRDI